MEDLLRKIRALHTTNMEDLLRKIRALYTTNIEIVELIESRSNKVCYSYKKTWVNGKLEIKESMHSVSVQSLCNNWKRSKTELSASDSFEKNLLVFGDHKIETEVDTWDELKALNGDMYEMVENIAPLLSPDSSYAIEALRNYLTNFELLQVAFGSIDELTTSTESKLTEVNKERDIVNHSLDRISSMSVEDHFSGPSVLNTPISAFGQHPRNITYHVGLRMVTPTPNYPRSRR